MSEEHVAAREEVAIRNALAIKAHSEDTRALLREAEENIQHLRNDVIAANNRIDQLRQQVNALLAAVFAGG